MTDLIARLRDYSPETQRHVVHEAADALEAKDETIDWMQGLLETCDAALEAQVKEVAAMRAEIAKLTYERDGWKREDEAECKENAALRELLMEAAPMVRSYRRKHERSFEQTSRKLFTEAAEGHAETVGRCDRILTAIDAFRAALKEKP